MKNKSAQDLVKIRWDNTSKHGRIIHAKKMQQASLKVRRANKVKREKLDKIKTNTLST